MKAYSNNICCNIIRLYNNGKFIREITNELNVSGSTIKRVLRKSRVSGNKLRKSQSGKNSWKLNLHRRKCASKRLKKLWKNNKCEMALKIKAGSERFWKTLSKNERRNKCVKWSSAGTIASSKLTRGSSIEIKIKKLLTDNKIKFVEQKWIGRTVPDFFIHPNICVYCDGSYWHSLPAKIKSDKRSNEFLLANGYRVIRLGEK